MEIYEAFTRKSNAVLFATDIAARGLDFPAVDWVVQLDCPEDANTYIHRAGRTARYEKGGESLLVLTPFEEPGMVEQLRTKRIPISKIKINPKMLQTQAKKIEAFLAKDSNLKQSAQRALVTYAKSIFLMKNKAVFDVNSLDTDSYSKSLGLAVPPRIRFIQKSQKNREQQKAKLAANNAHDPVKALRTSKVQISESKESNNDSESGNDSIMGSKETNIPNQEFNKDSSQNRSGWDGEGDSDSDDILQLKRRNHELEGESLLPEEDIPLRKSKNKKHVTKAAIAKKILKKKIVANKKIVFDEEGEVIANQTKDKISTLAKEYEQENLGGIDIDKAKLVLREEDKFDKQLFRDKAKAKRKETKRKEKKIKDDEAEVELEGTSSDEDSGPDLSWLPDPDKVYSSGKRSIKSKWSNIESDGSEQNISGGSDSREEGESDDSSDEEIEEIHRPLPLKRKLSRKNIRDKKRKQGSDDDQPMDTGLSLLEDEELALQFLKNK